MARLILTAVGIERAVEVTRLHDSLTFTCAEKCQSVPVLVHGSEKQQHHAVVLTASDILESERSVELLGKVVRLHGQADPTKATDLRLGDKRLKEVSPQTLASGFA